jgi:hypothetical protein
MIARKQMIGTRKQGGFMSGMDLAIALGVIFLIVGVIVQKGDWLNDSFRIWALKGQVSDVSQAVNEYTASNSISTVSMSNLKDLLPESIGDGQGANSFGGDIGVTWSGVAYGYTVTLTNIPVRAGARTAVGYSSGSYDSAAQTVSVTLGN